LTDEIHRSVNVSLFHCICVWVFCCVQLMNEIPKTAPVLHQKYICLPVVSVTPSLVHL
jgi:hypothetical protein